MSATEDDTELRDLLIHNLENNGILNKLKAEMRAAVFLAMEEQDKLENKTPLVNENLKKCLNTKDGRVVASLVIDFLQVFNLDFTLAVFQPEINSMNGLDSRTQVCCELGMSETDVNRNSPLLLELTKSSRHTHSEGDKATNIPKELSPKQIADARKKFDFYDKDRSGGVLKEDVRCVFSDLFPHFNKNMLESFISDELKTTDKASRKKTDFQEFLGLYKRLFAQCRTVVMGDVCEVSRPSNRFEEKMTSKIPRFRSPQQRVQEQCSAEGVELARGDPIVTSGGPGVKGDVGPGSGRPGDTSRDAHSSSSVLRRALDLDVEEDGDEGDSFFDDPLPKPQKTYGCSSPLGQTDVGSVKEDGVSGSLRRGESLNDLSVLDLDGVSEYRLSPEHRRVESSRTRDSPVGSLSDPAPQRSNDRDVQHCRNGTSTSRDRGTRDVKVMKDRSGSLGLDEDVEYDDDFNSHRSDLSKSELSIGEEIEEVSIEGPDISDKFDETTQDLSVSQLSQTHGADYMEDVA